MNIFRNIKETRITLVVASCMAVLVVACESPLDVNTPRVETPLTPPALVEPTKVDAQFTNAFGTFELDGTPIIRVDTTVTPMVVWMDLSMRGVARATEKPSLLRFRIRLDSVVAVPYEIKLRSELPAWMYMDLADRQGNSISDVPASDNCPASMVIYDSPREADGKRRATILIYVAVNTLNVIPNVAQEYVLGRLTLVF